MANYNSAYTGPQIDAILAAAQMHSNRNLLDNWDFRNPVNQRNVSGTIDTAGYFLDRWKLESGSVTIGGNGITLNGTIVQILETAVGTDVTASALTDEAAVVAYYDNNSKTISLTGTGQTFVAAKLELGPAQTLAHQDGSGNWVLNEIPDYGEQLARCQRYCQVFKYQNFSAFTHAYSSNAVYAAIPLPVAMRTTPTINDPTKFAVVTGGYTSENVPVTSVSSVSTVNCYLNFFASVEGGLTVNNNYPLKINGAVVVSADL